MQIVIVGPGAVGTALAAELFTATGCQSIWRDRNGFCEEARQVKFASGSTVTITAELPKNVPVQADVVFVTTRAFDVVQALRVIPTFVQPGAVVITLSNGYLVDAIANHCQHELDGFHLRIGMTSLAATYGAGLWRLTNHAPEIVFGPLDLLPPTEKEIQLCSQFNRARFVNDPVPYIRKKWLFNVVINGLCGLYRLPRNGELVQYRQDVDAVLGEAYRWGEEVWGEWLWSEDDLRIECWDLIRSTSANRNSMVRDLESGRASEMPFLAGIVEGQDADYPWLKRLSKI